MPNNDPYAGRSEGSSGHHHSSTATWGDMARAGLNVVRLNQDEHSARNPRQTAMTHIQGVLNSAGMQDADTVGRGVSSSIEAIRAVAGERGGRDVDRVFTNPQFNELYTIRSNDPRAPEAHRAIAAEEYRYWQNQHAARPTVGSNVAVNVPVDTRVRLQQTIGAATDWARRFEQAGRRTGDQFSGTHFLPPGGVAEAAARHRTSTRHASTRHEDPSAGAAYGEAAYRPHTQDSSRSARRSAR
ncbi:hypothetical protein ACWDE9_12045 [Streptomyces olivaceoviridis]